MLCVSTLELCMVFVVGVVIGLVVFGVVLSMWWLSWCRWGVMWFCLCVL